MAFKFFLGHVPLVLLIVLAVLFLVRYQMLGRLSSADGETIRIEGIVEEEPRVRGTTQTFTLGYPIIAHRYPVISYGDQIVVEGKSKEGRLVYPKITMRAHRQGNVVLTWLIRTRAHLVDQLQKTLPEPHASLYAGIVLGEKSGMTRSFFEMLSRTGTLHVVVASGMNVTLLANFVLLSAQWIARKWALIISSFVICLYMGLVGFDPPIVRATLMALVSFIAVFTGRQREALWLLMFISLLMLAASPHLFDSLSFRLSVMATAGVIMLGPSHTSSSLLVRQNRGLGVAVSDAFVRDLKTTLAAQAMVTPLIITAFHRLSIVSPLVNGLLLWSVGPLMVLGMAGALTLVLTPWMGPLFTFLLWPLAHLFISVLRWFDAVPMGSIVIPEIPGWIWIGYYGAIGGMWWRWKRR